MNKLHGNSFSREELKKISWMSLGRKVEELINKSKNCPYFSRVDKLCHLKY